QPARWEPLEERRAREHDEQKHGDEEARDRVAKDEDAAGPGVERLAVLHRLADAERDRDEVGQQRHPYPERYGDGQLLLDEIEDTDVAEVALAEVERQVIPHHHVEALVGGLVEAKLLFEGFDESGVEPLRA